MAIVNKLQVFDEQGNLVDYDILASDVKFNDGKDLPTKLAEMEDEIGEGGYQPPATGIPKSDLEQSVQDTLDSVANKVDKVAGKGLSTEDFTAALKAKLEALDPYTKTETDNAIANAVEGLGGGSVESVTVNGVNHTPVNGVVDLGTIQGAKGDKGDKGDTVVIDPDGLAQFEIANDLDTSDPTQGLSARQGKILKQAISTVQANLQAVLDALANMAFTSAKPTLSQIDWTGGTFYATINKTLNGCTTQNMNTEQVAEGQQFSMVLSALTGYTLTGATISVTNSKGQSVAYTFDNNTLTIAAANVVGTITVSVVAVEQVIYKGVWYEPKETGAYLHVGDDEDAIISGLYNLGDNRESAVNVAFSTTGGTSEKYGLLLFDANKGYVGFEAQESAEVVTSVPTSVRYVRLMTGATQAVLNLSYLKINGSMVFDGSGFNVSDALSSSDFMSSDSCPQPNSNGDYVGWLICKPNTPMSTDIKYDDPAIGKDVQSMLRRSVVTAIGGLETIQWVMGRKVALPSDGNTNFSAGEAQAPGTALPKLLLYGSENSYYGFMASDGGYNSSTRVRSLTIASKFTHARIVCSLSAYNSPSPYRIFIQAATSGEMLWSCPNNPND